MAILALVDRNRIRGKVLNPLTEEETKKLKFSAEKLMSVSFGGINLEDISLPAALISRES